MNYTNLNKLYWIKKDIESIKQELEEITILSAAQLTGMPHGTGKSDPTDRIVQKKIKLEERLQNEVNKYLDEKKKIEDYIDNIDNMQVKVIARKRFLLNEEWERIADEVYYSRWHCQRLLKEYLSKN